MIIQFLINFKIFKIFSEFFSNINTSISRLVMA